MNDTIRIKQELGQLRRAANKAISLWDESWHKWENVYVGLSGNPSERQREQLFELSQEATCLHVQAREELEKALNAFEPEDRCPVCGWLYARTTYEGCTPGNCSQRPKPSQN